MDNEEIKLRLFADDLTGFVRNNYSLTKFLDVVERFGKCSGLKVNEEKTEILLLGNRPVSYSNASTGSSTKWRIMWANLFKCKLISPH